MTLEEHLELMEQMAKEWHKQNDKPKSVRRAMRYIKKQKERREVFECQSALNGLHTYH